MTKEQQDLVWQCLPKEVRDEIKGLYVGLDSALNTILSKEALSNEECNRVRAIKDKKAIYERYFGRNNLTSDTEPSELLFVEKEKVIEYYKDVQQAIGTENGDTRIEMEGRRWAVLYLFGDKCMLDNQKTKDNMEEKELNLRELLKDCEGMEVYTTPYGELNIKGIDKDYITLEWGYACGTVLYHHNGRLFATGDITLFPSRALYEKYPLDAYSAWMEWNEERTPKRWRAKLGDIHYYLDKYLDITKEIESGDYKDNIAWNVGNYFRTKEEARQAAEAVRECLIKFHQENAENATERSDSHAR